MTGILANINKVFDHRIRLGIMSVLMVNDELDFNALKELLDVTDGNLASHVKGLEQSEYLEVRKTFIGKKPNTRYLLTENGKQAFRLHLKALEQLLSNNK